jgi:hypothetical protein
MLGNTFLAFERSKDCVCFAEEIVSEFSFDKQALNGNKPIERISMAGKRC